VTKKHLLSKPRLWQEGTRLLLVIVEVERLGEMMPKDQECNIQRSEKVVNTIPTI
jgi:hypothetical protein